MTRLLCKPYDVGGWPPEARFENPNTGDLRLTCTMAQAQAVAALLYKLVAVEYRPAPGNIMGGELVSVEEVKVPPQCRPLAAGVDYRCARGTPSCEVDHSVEVSR